MTGEPELLINPTNIGRPYLVQIPNGKEIHAKMFGRVKLGQNLFLEDVLYVLGFMHNLILES